MFFLKFFFLMLKGLLLLNYLFLQFGLHLILVILELSFKLLLNFNFLLFKLLLQFLFLQSKLLKLCVVSCLIDIDLLIRISSWRLFNDGLGNFEHLVFSKTFFVVEFGWDRIYFRLAYSLKLEVVFLYNVFNTTRSDIS